MARSVLFRLQDIRTTIADAQTFLSDCTEEDFFSNSLLRRAIERCLEIVSEATRHIPEDLKQREPGIPWKRVGDLGNVLRHVYQHVDPRLIWNIARYELPPLDAAVSRLMAVTPE